MTKKKTREKNKKSADNQHVRNIDLYNLGFTHYQAGRLKEAEDCCRDLLATSNNNPDAFHLLGMIRHRRGDDLQAIDFIKEAIAFANDKFFYHLNLGNIYFAIKNHHEAEACYQKALTLHPGFTPTLIHLAKNLEECQRQWEAISFYRKALSKEPDNYAALTGLGNALLAEGMIEESCVVLRRTIEVAPDQAESYYNLGGALRSAGDLDGAAAQYQKALQLRPDFIDAYFNLGTTFWEALKYESAVSSYHMALGLNPEYTKVHYSLGMVLDEQGRTVEAIESFRKAISFKSYIPEAEIYLAIYSWIDGAWEACRSHLDHLANKEKIEGKVKFIFAYLNYLDKLLKYRESHACEYGIEDDNLHIAYALGDSHCLSIAKARINYKGVDYHAESKLVCGCKAWHLANKDNNQYKFAFERRIESIPRGALVILMFGEIDCRIDEGIIKHYKKGNVNLTKSIIDLVNNYLEYVFRLVDSRGLFPVICNVPARLLCNDNASDSDKRLQKKVLEIFNQAMVENLSKRQISILDVYTFSNAQEGPESECHIDGNHLLPSIFVRLLREL